jgi:hypothetical protein
MYEYPPSKEILRYGPLQEGTHYYCEGVAFTRLLQEKIIDPVQTKVKRIPCVFEVAYNHKCQIVVVCYFGISLLDSKHRRKRLSYTNSPEECFRLIGREVKYGLNVCVEGLSLIVHSPSILQTPTYYTTESRSIYFAKCFNINLPASRLLKAIELEATSDEYSQEYETHFSVTGCEFIKLDQIFYFQLLETDNDCFLTLKPICTYAQREHDNEVTGTLIVPKKCVPQGWTASEIVDIWCALTSLSMGRDIQWVSSYLPLRFEQYPQEITWQYRKVYAGRLFHAYIAGRSNFSATANFVRECFTHIVNGGLSPNEAKSYVSLFRQFVYYQLMGVKDAEGIARLVTTLTEAFLFTWERNTDSKPKTLLSRAERRKLDKVILEYLRSQDFVEQFGIELGKTTEADFSQDNSDFKRIIDKVMDIFRNNMRPSFHERLEFFFEDGDHFITDLEWRIKAFIATRNSIAHNGNLLHFSDDKDSQRKVQQLYISRGKTWEDEYRNALMILPLMMMRVFGYSGVFREPNGWV